MAIQPSGRFGGGGGGSHREVSFVLTVKTDPSAKREIDSLGKAIDDLQKRANVRLGGAGGLPTTATTNGLSSSGRFSSFAQEQVQLRRLDEERRRSDREREMIRRREVGEEAKRLSRLKSGFMEALEGATSLTRGMVLLGVASEESLEKAVRTLAKFEAAAAAVRGTVKLSAGIGTMLGIGARGGGLVLAGVTAAAVTGKAIQETIAMRHGRGPGMLGRGISGAYTGAYGYALQQGWMSRADLERQAAISPLVAPYVNLALGQADTRARFGQYATATGRELGGNQLALGGARDELSQALARRQGYLALAGGAADRTEAAALHFAAMGGGEQRSLLTLRKRFLDKGPGGIRTEGLLALAPTLGVSEQGDLRRELVRRAGGLLDQGGLSTEREQLWQGIRGAFMETLRLPQKREIVLKLTERNEELMTKWEGVMTAALQEADKVQLERLQEISDRLMAQQKQLEAGRLSRESQIGAALGGTPF